MKYNALATPTLRSLSSFASKAVEPAVPFACCLRLAKLASASKPRGLSVLSGRECSFGDPVTFAEGALRFTGVCGGLGDASKA